MNDQLSCLPHADPSSPFRSQPSAFTCHETEWGGLPGHSEEGQTLLSSYNFGHVDQLTVRSVVSVRALLVGER